MRYWRKGNQRSKAFYQGNAWSGRRPNCPYIDNNRTVNALESHTWNFIYYLRLLFPVDFRPVLTFMARDGINNLICDNILRKFDGQKAITRARLRDQTFHANIDGDWAVIERHIDFLIQDRTLKEEDEILSLTNKGWFMLNNAEKVGYVAQKIEEAQWRKSESDTRVIVRATVSVALGATALWALHRLIALLV